MDLSDADTISVTDSTDGSPTRKVKKKKKIGLFHYKSKKIERRKDLYFKDSGNEVHVQETNVQVATSLVVETTSNPNLNADAAQNSVQNGVTSAADNVIAAEATEAKTNSNPKMFPPSARTHELHVVLLSGERLAARDTNGFSDPYVKVKVNNKTVHKSKCCKMTLDPRWNEEFTIEVNEWSNVSLYVYDWDIGFRDDFIGCAAIDLSRLDATFTDVTLELEDDDSAEDLGLLHLSLALRPIRQKSNSCTETDSAPVHAEATPTLKRAQALPACKSVENDIRSSTRSRQDCNSIRRSQPVALATVQLVSGSDLPSRDANGLSDPYVKLQMDRVKKKSKVCYKTLQPVWKEEFTFHLFDEDRSMLDVTVWDRDKYRSDDFMGRCELDLWSLERDVTHSLSLNLVDTQGTLLFLVTVHKTRSDPNTRTVYDLSELRQRYSTVSTFNDLPDVGFAEIRVVSACNLRSADINGKSDPFCVVKLCNARAQTQTCYKTLDPVWNRVFTFPVHDIHDCFEVFIFDQDKDSEREFLGRVSVPILSAANGEERNYVLKDRKLKNRTKGEVTVQISYIFNPIRAAVRTFSPREERFMQENIKFKKNLLVQNFQRVWRIVQSLIATAEFINSCFTWENPRRSAFAFVTFLMIAWNFELYMLPIVLLVLFMKNYVDIFVRGTRLARHEEIENVRTDEDDDDDEKQNKTGLLQKLNALQDVLAKVQSILDTIASFGERVYNTFTWSVPFLSVLAFVVLSAVSVILYFVPVRTIVLLWGINKFTKKLRKPNYIPNNELMDFLSRIPCNVELEEFRELKSKLESPRHSKKKK